MLVLEGAIRSAEATPSPVWSSPSSPASPYRTYAPAWLVRGSYTELAPVYLSFLHWGQVAEVDAVFQEWSDDFWIKEMIPSLCLLAMLLLIKSGMMCTISAPGHDAGSCSGFCPQGPSSQAVPSLRYHKSFFLPKYRTLYSSTLNFIRFLSAHPSSLSRSPWMTALPLSISVGLP